MVLWNNCVVCVFTTCVNYCHVMDFRSQMLYPGSKMAHLNFNTYILRINRCPAKTLLEKKRRYNIS